MDRREQASIFGDWIDRHRGLLFKVVRSFARTFHDQNDLLQEITLQVWKSIPSYSNQVADTTWMYRVALYTAINWNRREEKYVRRMSELETESVVQLDDTPSDPRVEWLYDRISELESIDRSIALLLLDGLSYREMAKAIGISESNIGARVNRIKKKLIQRIPKEMQYEF